MNVFLSENPLKQRLNETDQTTKNGVRKCEYALKQRFFECVFFRKPFKTKAKLSANKKMFFSVFLVFTYRDSGGSGIVRFPFVYSVFCLFSIKVGTEQFHLEKMNKKIN